MLNLKYIAQFDYFSNYKSNWIWRTYALPLIKDAIEEYLRLNAVEIAVSSANWDGGKVCEPIFFNGGR